jgi:hypothetical protein
MEGTPLDTSSWALYREGLQPRGCEGLLDTLFLKLEKAIFNCGEIFGLAIFITSAWGKTAELEQLDPQRKQLS